MATSAPSLEPARGQPSPVPPAVEVPPVPPRPAAARAVASLVGWALAGATLVVGWGGATRRRERVR